MNKPDTNTRPRHFGFLNELYLPGRRNSIGFLRFLLAILVIISHSFQIGGFGIEPLVRTSRGNTLGHFSVFCFFILSGFLIARSYETSDSLLRYLWHRFLRIFPGFWMCLLFVTFVIAPIVCFVGTTPHSLQKYFYATQDTPFHYIINNVFLTENQRTIGSLLQHAPQACCINGSLWTLIHEFHCYLIIALFGACGLLVRWKKAGLVLMSGLFLIMWERSNYPAALPVLKTIVANDAGADLVCWFCIGTVFYLLANYIPFHPILFLLSASASVLCICLGQQHLWGAVPLAYSFFWLAAKLPLSWWDRRGDYSYGLYIYAWPSQQLLVAFDAQQAGLVVYTVLSVLIASILAVLSYHYVEKPALSLKTIQLKQLKRIADSSDRKMEDAA